MTISEKVAYIKGLAENAGFDENESKDKVVKAIIDVLEDIAGAVGEINEQLDAVDEDLAALEDDYYEEYDEDEDDDEDDDDFCYEVECPTCHDVIYLDDEMIDEGGIKCPNCGEELEFDLEGCAALTPDLVIVPAKLKDSIPQMEELGLTVLDEAMTSEPYAFAFQKGSELVAPFNEALDALLADGTIEQIFQQYGVTYIAP